MSLVLAVFVTVLFCLAFLYGWLVILCSVSAYDWREALLNAIKPTVVVVAVLGGIAGSIWLLTSVWAAVPS